MTRTSFHKQVPAGKTNSAPDSATSTCHMFSYLAGFAIHFKKCEQHIIKNTITGSQHLNIKKLMQRGTALAPFGAWIFHPPKQQSCTHHTMSDTHIAHRKTQIQSERNTINTTHQKISKGQLELCSCTLISLSISFSWNIQNWTKGSCVMPFMSP